jgi:hypothetical protein
MRDVAGILDRAADLIEPEGMWTRQSYARDAKGREISPESPEATCFCMMGAISRVASNHADLHAALALVGEGLPPSPKYNAHIGGADYVAAIARFNDAPERTQAEVVAKLREAAAKAQEPQP